MSAVNNINRNYLSPINFKLVLQRAPSLKYFLQSASIPGLSFEGSINFTNPFPKIPIPGDHLNYSPLSISFMVDEDLSNYLEIWNWMFNIAGPTTLEPASSVNRFGFNNSVATDPMTAIRSDIKLMIMTSSKNPNIEVTFKDAMPVTLGELNFSTTATDVTYLESSVTFEYTTYEIVKL